MWVAALVLAALVCLGPPLAASPAQGATSPARVASGAASAPPAFHAGVGLSTNSDWAALVLRDGGWPVSTANVTVLLQWMASEQPPGEWWYRDNPLNNGLGDPSGAYPDLAEAAYYVAVNLDAGDDGYPAVVADLAASAPPATTARAIWASSWAAGHYDRGATWWEGSVAVVAAPLPAWVASGELLEVGSTGPYYEVVGGAALEVPPADVRLLEGSAAEPPVQVDAAELVLFAPTPAGGTLVRSVQTGDYYVVAGGAPLYVADCAALGGCSGAVPVDQWDLDHRGSPASGFAAVPADGTVLSDDRTGQEWVVAGGAPLAVADPADLGRGAIAPVVVDGWDIANAGVAGIHPFDTLSRRPAAGTLLEGASTGRVYQVGPSGAATYDPAASGGAPVGVDQAALDRAGSGGVWDHLANDPPTVAFTPAAVTAASATVVVHFPRPVLSSSLAAMSVRYRLGGGAWQMPASWRMTGAPAVTYTGFAAGQTVCFEVRATDSDGVSSPWTGARCWTRVGPPAPAGTGSG